MMRKNEEVPLVSVIMSTYNMERTLIGAIESILSQTYTKFEFIIVNDGSSDNTSEILEDYKKKDERIKVISHENKGLTRSLNIAIDQSRGDYIARQDADDISHKNRLELQIATILRDPSVEFLTSLAILNKEKTVPSGMIRYLLCENSLLLGNVFIHGTFFVKSRLLKELKYNEDHKYAQDFELVTRALSCGQKVGLLLVPLYELLQGENNISARKKSDQDFYVRKAIRENLKRSDSWATLIQSINVSFLNRILRLILLVYLKLSCRRNNIVLMKTGDFSSHV